MGEPISSISAVVGLADVIFKTSTSLYSFFSELRDAPKEIQTITYSLSTWRSISQNVKHLSTQWQVSQFATEDGLALGDISEALSSCRDAFGTIETLVEGHITLGSSALSRQTKKMKWVFNAKKIQAAQNKLDSSKLSLIAALSTFGRSAHTLGLIICSFKLISLQSK